MPVPISTPAAKVRIFRNLLRSVSLTGWDKPAPS